MTLSSFQFAAAYIGVGDYNFDVSNNLVAINHFAGIILFFFWIPDFVEKYRQLSFVKTKKEAVLDQEEQETSGGDQFIINWQVIKITYIIHIMIALFCLYIKGKYAYHKHCKFHSRKDEYIQA